VDPATSARLARLLGTAVTAASRLGGQHGVSHYRLTMADGRSAFAKIQDQNHAGNEAIRPGAVGRAAVAGDAAEAAGALDAGEAGGAPGSAWGAAVGFAAEAASLRWLAQAGSTPVPGVLASDQTCLVIDWIDGGSPTPGAAARFGRELASLHMAGADRFGARWPGVIAGLPLPNAQADSWPQWFAANRLLPYARIARDAGTLSAADTRLIESAAARSPELAGSAEPPSRIHGDCWSGNVLWAGGRGWLIDPAAHGGHRETDLAMLVLFGAPYLDQIVAGYSEVAPLADGWRSRMPLHQLHPLLVHVCLFGASYRESVLAAVRAVLAA
jgi:fructosamine-3-kinase